MSLASSVKLNRHSQEYIVLSTSLAACIGIIPFAIHRLVTRDWGIAALDCATFVALLCMFFYVYRTRDASTCSWILSLLFLLAEIFTVAIKGPSHLVWSFPSTVGIYYLLSVPRAAFLNLLALIFLVSLTHASMSMVELSSYVIALVVTNIFTIVSSLRNLSQQQQLQELTLKDPLTGASNRRALDNFLRETSMEASSGQRKQCMILLDIDRFKVLNERHGALIGDEILVHLVAIIRTQLHHDERIFRMGGEEFVIAPVQMDIHTARNFAERLRKIVEQATFVNQISDITISVGLAEFIPGEEGDAWLSRADSALRMAKLDGRNRTHIAL